MEVLIGDFGSIQLLGGGGGTMLIPRDVAVALFRRVAIQETNYAQNELGMYSFASVGRSNKASFLSLSGPKHILQSRKNGCTFNPKGQLTNEITDVTMCPVEVNMEICPDSLWDSCFEQILGVGNGINDFFATPEGDQLLMHIMELVYTGLGNSYADLVQFGKHPLIAAANAANSYTVGQGEWNDYRDQQASCTGLITLVDALKAAGLPNYQYTIATADLSPNGLEFTGDAMGLIDQVINAAPGELATFLEARGSKGEYGICSVSPSIYNRLEEQFMTTYGVISEGYRYRVSGMQTSLNGTNTLPGVLLYKGVWVTRRNDWKKFDLITGTTTHRALLQAPGVLGLAHDVADIKQFGGQGLVLQRSPDIRDKGKISMITNYDVATAILNQDFLVNASLTLTA